MPALRQVTVDSTNARASAEFWRQLLGLVYRDGHEVPVPPAPDVAGGDWLNLFTNAGAPCMAFQQVSELPRSTWPTAEIPAQLHLDLSVRNVDELDDVHSRVIALGGQLRFDRSDDDEEPLRVYADLDGHPFCVFVAPSD